MPLEARVTLIHYPALRPMKYLSFLSSLVLLGCAEMISSARPVQRYELEQAVHEAVLRELMRDHPPSRDAICIGVRYSDSSVPPYERVDPGATFLSRFRDIASDVYPKSQCGITALVELVRHRLTGRTAVIYDVSAVRWLSSGEAEVGGTMTESSLGGFSCDYRVRREGAKWRVGECRNRVVS